MEMEKLVDMVLDSSMPQREKEMIVIQIGKADGEARREAIMECIRQLKNRIKPVRKSKK